MRSGQVIGSKDPGILHDEMTGVETTPAHRLIEIGMDAKSRFLPTFCRHDRTPGMHRCDLHRLAVAWSLLVLTT